MAFKSFVFSKGALRVLQKIHVRQIKTTVDAEDVYRHTQKMRVWWDENGEMAPLHSLNYLRIPFIRDGILNTSIQNGDTCLKGKKILDVGCGGGILSEGLAKLGADVTGIDASEELIELAKQHSIENKELTNNRPTYVFNTIEEHSVNNTETYDAVVASEIIEHVNEKELFVKSCVRATKPGGKLFFTTPSRTRLSQFYFIFLNETLLGNIPKGTHEYEKFMTPDQLKVMLESNGCSVQSCRGFILGPITKKWKWTNHKLVTFSMEATKNIVTNSE